MAANFIVVIMLQHINKLNQHIIYLKLNKVMFDFYINKKSWGKNKPIKTPSSPPPPSPQSETKAQIAPATSLHPWRLDSNPDRDFKSAGKGSLL